MKERLEFKVDEEWKEFSKKNPWALVVMESAVDSNGVKYLRKKGSDVVYREVGDGCVCADCGSEIMAVEVARPIWDGIPHSMPGSGKCYREEVPYCPKCEKATDSRSGRPIEYPSN